MAYVLTYNSLYNSIKEYVERSNPSFLELIPQFIMIAQRQLARDLKIVGLKVAVTGNLIPGNQLLQKPNRWANDTSFTIYTSGTGDNSGTVLNTRKELLLRSDTFVFKYSPDATKLGEPKYYSAEYNYNYWYFAPTPDIGYVYESIYYQTPELIDETISTNFFTERLPDVLEIACLRQASWYLKDFEQMPAYDQKYTALCASIDTEDLLRIYDGYCSRMG